MKSLEDKNKKIVCLNRKAKFNFFLLEFLEAGIVLKGTEVKSLRHSKASLDDSFAMLEKNEVYLYNCHISPYEYGNRYNEDPKRVRKLLLHKSEIEWLRGKTEQRGLTLVSTSLYFKNGKAKVELALAKGKKHFDKRDDIKKREAGREMERAQRNRYK
ncbi:MAG: SsrA-binding protein SmpB [bacterium]